VEGIETPEQLVVAISAGADHLQGFLLARPALAGTIFDDAALSVAALSSGAAPGAQATSR
jgi:EAL domain-containing protein (putative c-di-GMP-specific phosphodiesterase class I)